MNQEDLKQYAIKAVSNILPLDHDTCSEMIDYVLTLPTDHEIQNHFLNLLGESEDSLSFIHKFIEQKNELARKKSSQKKKFSESHDRAEKQKSEREKPVWGASGPDGGSKAGGSGDSKGRLSGKTKSTTTSQLLQGKVKAPSSTSVKKSKKKNLDNLKDIEAVLTELELNDHASDAIRVCNCMATRHPLFEVAPNCLNCGKIICAKEGLQPCSYCGNELLSAKERVEIMNILTSEREGLEEKQPDLRKKLDASGASGSASPKPKSKKIVVTMKPGEKFWEAQDRALKEADRVKKLQSEKLAQEKKEREELAEQEKELKHYERSSSVEPALLAAQERLETLLNFQATGAERTRIIDNAADFDTPTGGISSGSMWLSPIERALQLKKQQRQMRKQEVADKNRTGRGKKIVEMVIHNGKVEMVERYAMPGESVDDGADNHDPENEDIKELEDRIKQQKNLEESVHASNVWDYERDSNLWEKPVYTVHETDSGKGPNADDLPVLQKPRVQFFNDSETNELLV